MTSTPRVEEFLPRLEDVSRRLERHAETPRPEGLTEPDPPTGERWEWGQVWAHLAEFPAYWMEQIALLLGDDRSEPVPFGRVKSDPARLSAIEAGRGGPSEGHWERLDAHIGELRRLLVEMSPEAWSKRGIHQTLGVMDMKRIVDEFLVGHLEEHADQLDALVAEGAGRS